MLSAGCTRCWSGALLLAAVVGGCAQVAGDADVGSGPVGRGGAPPAALVVGPEVVSPASTIAPDAAATQASLPPAFVVAPALATSTAALAPTVPPTPTSDPYALIGPPVRIEIPAIGVAAPVELVGLTADRAMDVPKGWMNVGWYREGYRPGEPGNAVLAGHLDTSSGGPAVFWSLDKLQPGDEVVVVYGNGDRYAFMVEGQELYDHDAAGPIIDRIFGESLTSDLNLVTCDGAWDHGRATYTHRLVVFTTLAPERSVRANDASIPVE